MKRLVAAVVLLCSLVSVISIYRVYRQSGAISDEITVALQSVPSPTGNRQTYYIVSLCGPDKKRLVTADRLAREAIRMKSGRLSNDAHGIWADLPAQGKALSLVWRGRIPLPSGAMLYAEAGKSPPGSVLDVTVGTATRRLDVSTIEGDSPIYLPLGEVRFVGHRTASLYLIVFPLILVCVSARALATGRWWFGKQCLERAPGGDEPGAVRRSFDLWRVLLVRHVCRIVCSYPTALHLLAKKVLLCRLHFIGLILIGLFLFAWYPKPSSIDSDPESAYVANCILMAQGQPITHADHPGTTTQLIGAVLARLGKFGSENIVARYDQFRFQFYVIVFAICAALWLVMVSQREASGIWALSTLASGLLCFTGRESVYALSAVSSESGIFLTGIVVLALLATRKPDFRWTTHAALAVTAGFALASKINVLPFCAGLMIVSTAIGACNPKRFVLRSSVFGLIAGGCFFAIIYSTGVVSTFARFLSKLVDNRGILGKGSMRTGIADFLPESSAVLTMWDRDWSLLILTAVAVLLSVLLIAVRWRIDRTGAVRALGWFVAIVGSFVPLLEHSYWRYFLPGIFAVIGLLLFEFAAERRRSMQIATVCFCIFVALPACRWAMRYPSSRRSQAREYVRHTACVNRALMDYHPDLLAMGFNVNTSLGFVQLLTTYHDRSRVGAQPPPTLDPYRQYAVELGSYLPWSENILVRGESVDPRSRKILVVTATPLVGALLSDVRLVASDSDERLFLYMTGECEGVR